LRYDYYDDNDDDSGGGGGGGGKCRERGWLDNATGTAVELWR